MTELVTQIQDKVKQIGTMMGQSAGVLQRDAVPVSITGEDVPDAGTSVKIDNEAAFWAKSIVGACKDLDLLIAQLPDDSRTEEQQIEALAALQREHREVDASLKTAADRLRRTLSPLESLHAALADDILALRGSGAGGREAGGAAGVPGGNAGEGAAPQAPAADR